MKSSRQLIGIVQNPHPIKEKDCKFKLRPQKLLTDFDDPPEPLPLEQLIPLPSSLEALISYVQYMSANPEAVASARIGSDAFKEILKIHREHPHLIVSHYITTALPSPGLLKLLGGFDHDFIEDFFSDLSLSYKQFLHSKSGQFCFTPVVVAPKKNPFVRYQNSHSAGCHQAKKLLTSHFAKVVNDFSLTFPKQISVLLLDDEKAVLLRADAARDLFFSKLRKHCLEKIGRDPETSALQLGYSVSRHKWATNNPFEPHLHFHAILPHAVAPVISAKKRALVMLELFFRWQRAGKRLSDPRVAKRFSAAVRKALGILDLPWDTIITDVKATETSCKVVEKKIPFDHSFIRELWRECLRKIFPDEMQSVDAVDIYLKFSCKFRKNKLGCRVLNQQHQPWVLHKFIYKTRPAVVDLAKWLEKNNLPGDFNPGFVRGLLVENTDTLVFGFWRKLKNSHQADFFTSDIPCSLCNGSLKIKKTHLNDEIDPNLKVVLFVQAGGKFCYLKGDYG